MLESESYSVTEKKTTKQKRFYISSRSGPAEEFSGLIRQHWSIKNSCHWVLDTLYREDHSQVRIEKAVKNFAILRRMGSQPPQIRHLDQEIAPHEANASDGR